MLPFKSCHVIALELLWSDNMEIVAFRWKQLLSPPEPWLGSMQTVCNEFGHVLLFADIIIYALKMSQFCSFQLNYYFHYWDFYCWFFFTTKWETNSNVLYIDFTHYNIQHSQPESLSVRSRLKLRINTIDASKYNR